MTQGSIAQEEHHGPGWSAWRRWAAPVAAALLPIVLALAVSAR